MEFKQTVLLLDQPSTATFTMCGVTIREMKIPNAIFTKMIWGENTTYGKLRRYSINIVTRGLALQWNNQ